MDFETPFSIVAASEMLNALQVISFSQVSDGCII